MTTARQIIVSAYRETNITAILSEPTDAEVTEALGRLNSLIASVFGTVVGIYPVNWPAPPQETAPTNAAYPNQPQPQARSNQVWPFPPNNARIVYGETQGGTTMYLPQTPDDGAQIALAAAGADFAASPLTLDANGFLINGARTLVIDEYTAPRLWFFREDRADWTEITTLTETDEMPFPIAYDDYFILTLAARINPRNAKDMTQLSIARLVEVTEQMRTKYTPRFVSTLAPTTDEFNTQQSYDEHTYAGRSRQLYGR